MFEDFSLIAHRTIRPCKQLARTLEEERRRIRNLIQLGFKAAAGNGHRKMKLLLRILKWRGSVAIFLLFSSQLPGAVEYFCICTNTCLKCFVCPGSCMINVLKWCHWVCQCRLGLTSTRWNRENKTGAIDLERCELTRALHEATGSSIKLHWWWSRHQILTKNWRA